jgi:hypothetical protein
VALQQALLRLAPAAQTRTHRAAPSAAAASLRSRNEPPPAPPGDAA